jgi:hypothetical protein
MFGDHSHRIASGVANAHGATRAVPDDVGHALLLVLVAVLSLIALLIVVARLEPRENAPGVARRRWVSTPPEHGRREPGTTPIQRV